MTEQEHRVHAAAFAASHAWHISVGVDPLEAAERAIMAADEAVDAYRYAITIPPCEDSPRWI